MSVNVKLGVEYSQFKKGMGEAAASVKTLNEKLKQNESQLKLTGDQEIYFKNKVDLLNQQIEAQRQVVINAKKALDSLEKQGVSKASKQYQEMERSVYKASDELNKMQIQLRDVEGGTDKAGKAADTMNDSLKRVGDGVSWENLTDGIGKVNDMLERGARAAINFGKRVLNSAKGSTEYADELLTMSTKYGIDVETLQRMEHASEFIDTDVETILNAKARLAKNKDSLPELMGFDADGMSLDEAFWKAGEAIMAMTDEFEKEEAAQKVFGRGWKELVPLFTAGQEEYNQVLQEQNVLTEEQVRTLGEADDAIKRVEQQIELMKNQFWAENADKIVEVLNWVVEHKDEVVEALKVIGIAFAGMKIGEFALNIMKAVDGIKQLHLLGGNPKGGSPTGGSPAVDAGKDAVKTGIWAKAASAAKWMTAGTGWVPFAVTAAATMPAAIVNNAEYRRIEEETQARLALAATASNKAHGDFLAQSALALGLNRQNDGSLTKNFLGQYWLGGNEKEISEILTNLGKGSDLEKSMLHNMLAGSSSSWNGNYAWNELQEYWKTGGADFDAGRERALLESITGAYERMIQTQEETERRRSENAVTSQDLQALNELPVMVANAVSRSMSNVTIIIDDRGVGAIGANVSRQFGNAIAALVK